MYLCVGNYKYNVGSSSGIMENANIILSKVLENIWND